MTYDVTAALNAIGICVFMADIYVEPPEEMEPGAERRPQELHRFLVHLSDGCRLSTAEQKRCARSAGIQAHMRAAYNNALGAAINIVSLSYPSTSPPLHPRLKNWQALRVIAVVAD